MGKTAKVRVLVVVDSDGNWGAMGSKGAEFSDLIHGAADHLNGGLETQAWITVDVPLPPDPIELTASIDTSQVINPETQ